MSDEQIKCKYCKETVLKEAIFCKHCKKKIGVSTADKIIGGLVWFFIGLCALTWLYLHNSGTDNNVPDINKLSAFHKKLMILDLPLERATKQFSQAFKRDVKKGNMYALYADAQTLYNLAQSTSYQLTVSIDVPNFKNTQVQNYVQKVYDSFNNYCIALMGSTKSVMNMANNPDPETIATAKSAVPSDMLLADQSSAEISVNLIEAYGMLGYDPNKIDTNNGGLLIPHN